MRSVKITVRGIVQMVGFRFFVQRHASGLGIRGYVRNMPNGDVEAVALGEGENMQRFIQLIRQGPPSSRVEDTDLIEDYDPGEQFVDFGVRF